MQWQIDLNFLDHDFLKLTLWTPLDIKKGQNTIRRSSSRNGKRIVKMVTHVRSLASANQISNIVLRNHNINSMNFWKKK